MPLKVIDWQHDRMVILDQTLLPQKEVYRELKTVAEAVTAIKELQVRGAPAIGIAAGYAVCLGALNIDTGDTASFRRELDAVITEIDASRPTARNLFRATERMRQAAATADNTAQIKTALLREAVKIHADEETATRRISELGITLIPTGAAVLTHCNAGALATATTYGTALGVIVMAHEQGKNINVLATETRPLLQGARLTAWELQKANVPTRLITDSMAGHFMKAGKIDCVITGADRIAANGDSANKIGTYQLAVLAREHDIPFYIAAPVSTIDMSIASGDEIPIEERDATEVTSVRGIPTAPDGMAACNPAFDVTPAKFISAIITEKGIIEKPFADGLEGIFIL